MSLSCLKFSDLLPETQLFFIWPFTQSDDLSDILSVVQNRLLILMWMFCCLAVTCWQRADLLALVGDVYCIFVSFPCGILGQVWNLSIVS